MTPSLRDSLAQVVALLDRATPGGWTVVEDKLPWSFADGRSGMHTQRRIFTAWDHPQMKGPIGITNLSIGVGLHDAERKGVQFVSMSLEDAEAIIAAVAWLREHGPALLRDAGDASDSARLDWLESGGRVSHDKALGMFVAAHGGGTPYWNATYRGAIDDAISGYKDTAMHAPGGAGGE